MAASSLWISGKTTSTEGVLGRRVCMVVYWLNALDIGSECGDVGDIGSSIRGTRLHIVLYEVLVVAGVRGFLLSYESVRDFLSSAWNSG